MRRRSLLTRLTLSHVLITLAGVALLGAALLILVQRNLRAQTLANLTAQAQVYGAYASEIAVDPNALAAFAPNMLRRFNLAPDTTVRVLAPNGAVIFATRNLGPFPSSAARPLLTNPLPIQPLALENDRIFAAQPIVRGGQPLGVIELSQTVERERAVLRQLLVALVPSALVALLAAAIAGHLLARSLVRPLHQLGRVATAIAGGDTKARSHDHSRDEIGQVAARLNTMADELQARLAEVEQLADARQQFYRAVSHELRTPLTAIRGTAENLEDDARSDQHDSLVVIQNEAARLQRLVDELLNPRGNAPEPLRRRQPLNLSELVVEVSRIMQPRADRGGVTLNASATPHLSVRGDRDRLKQAFLNLLDNALTWTPAGGTVRITAEQDATFVRITVHDSGPGIDPGIRKQVWERGVSTNGGQGFGLALVRDVVKAHGGTAILREGSGTTVELQLPLDNT